MKNNYNRAMEKIVVTSEMKERILTKLKNTSVEESVMKKTLYMRFQKMALVACLIVLVIGGVFISDKINKPSPPPVQITNPFVEYNSLDEISKITTYKIKTPSILPFEVSQEQYYLVDEKIVEVLFIGENTISYRTIEGLQDISGNYNAYNNVKKIIINDYNITLKGDSDKYTLAIFSDKNYSYSLQFEKPLTQDTIIDMIKSIK